MAIRYQRSSLAEQTPIELAVGGLIRRDTLQHLGLTALVLAAGQIDGGHTGIERDDRTAAQRGTRAPSQAPVGGRETTMLLHTQPMLHRANGQISLGANVGSAHREATR